MSRTCTICSHEKRGDIEAAVVAGASYRDIAGQFQTSKTAIARHVTEHISESLRASEAVKEEARGLDVVKQLKDINETTIAILQSVKSQEGKEFLALQAIDRVCKQLELQAKLLGDIDAPQVNIIVMPEWRTIRGIIVAALGPYPDARIAVAEALSQIEQQ